MAHNPRIRETFKLVPGQSRSWTLTFERRDSARTPCPQYGGTIAVMRADDPT